MELRTLSILLVFCVGCSGGQGASTGVSGQSGADGSATGGAGGTAGGVLTADNFGMAFEDALCGPEVACHVWTNLAACETGMVFAESMQILSDVAAVHRGTIHFDSTAAAACLAGLPTYCFQPPVPFKDVNLAVDVFNNIPACATVFTGLVPQGGVCAINTECANQLGCVPNTPSCATAGVAACCPGTCEPQPPGLGSPQFPTVGQPCNSQAFCVPPAVCGPNLPEVCIMPPAEGEPCTNDTGCARLDDFCALQGTTTICVPTLADGAACDPSRILSENCVRADVCGSSNTCVPYAPPASCNTPCQAPLICAQTQVGAVCTTAMPGTTCTPGTSS
jgi:hypothetical protein